MVEIFIVLVVGRKAIWDRMWGLKRGGTSGRNIERQIEVIQSCILDVRFEKGLHGQVIPCKEAERVRGQMSVSLRKQAWCRKQRRVNARLGLYRK